MINIKGTVKYISIQESIKKIMKISVNVKLIYMFINI